MALIFCAAVCIGVSTEPAAPSDANIASLQKRIAKIKAKIRLTKRVEDGARKQRIRKRLRKDRRKTRQRIVAILRAPKPAAFIEMVRVGNPGNAPDPLNSPNVSGIGGVPYEYQIGKYEVTLDQYVTFLNAVAGVDTYGLYNPGINALGVMIERSAEEPYTYQVVGSGQRPVSYVSWFDAARFCNWLHNGRPSGAQDETTTESGAYLLLGATSGSFYVRNPEANYWIPSLNEWYKAAYHDPRTEAEGGPPGDDFYWLFPTQSDAPPLAEAPPGSGANSANYSPNPGIPTVGSVTDAGAYTNTMSYYGTFDQAGNLFEWNDFSLFNGSDNRGSIGGAWNFNLGLASTQVQIFGPGLETQFQGFRVAGPAGR